MPQICPPPPDCPLYDQRLAYGSDEPLRRAILREQNKPRTMAALVWADLNRQHQRPQATQVPALPPTPEPLPLPISTLVKGASNG